MRRKNKVSFFFDYQLFGGKDGEKIKDILRTIFEHFSVH
jgi:hypothetical protein